MKEYLSFNEIHTIDSARYDNTIVRVMNFFDHIITIIKNFLTDKYFTSAINQVKAKIPNEVNTGNLDKSVKMIIIDKPFNDSSTSNLYGECKVMLDTISNLFTTYKIELEDKDLITPFYKEVGIKKDGKDYIYGKYKVNTEGLKIVQNHIRTIEGIKYSMVKILKYTEKTRARVKKELSYFTSNQSYDGEIINHVAKTLKQVSNTMTDITKKLQKLCGMLIRDCNRFLESCNPTPKSESVYSLIDVGGY